MFNIILDTLLGVICNLNIHLKMLLVLIIWFIKYISNKLNISIKILKNDFLYVKVKKKYV